MQRLRQFQLGRTAWLAPLAGTLLACSSQVESDYKGEPIATLSGVVAASSSLEDVPEVEAAIVWNTLSEDGPIWVGERIEVTGSFPANFKLNLYAAPPADAEVPAGFDYCVTDAEAGVLGIHADDEPACGGLLIPKGTGTGMWVGFLAAIRADAPDGEIELSDVIGIDPDHMLLYHDHASDDPLPAMPTAAQAAAALDVAIVMENLEHEVGYLLLEENPAWADEQADADGGIVVSSLPQFLDPSDDGLDEPITIQLGLGIEDAL